MIDTDETSVGDPNYYIGLTDINGRTFYNGSMADFKIGDVVQGGYSSNYKEPRSPWMYFSETVFTTNAR